MATTFDVFYLGTGPSIDPTEGDSVSENASVLVGLTYGTSSDPLVNHIGSFSPGSTGYSGGDATRYDTDNNLSNDTFRIDGGADQVVDGLAIYNATITYVDGTTATITSVVVQDAAGNLYLVPETTYNSDQAALEAAPIRSLTLDSVASNNTSLTADRYAATYDTSDWTVDGTVGNDSMGVGYTDADGDQITVNDDRVLAGAGNDAVSAGAGNDTVDGGTGDDLLIGGDGNDSLLGGDGNDTLQGDGPAVTVNQVSNGTFDTDTAGWTRTGNVDWDAGFVTLNVDSGFGTLSYDTTLTGLDAGNSASGTGQVQFDFHWANGSPDVSGATTIDVQIGGVTYATIETGGLNGTTANVTYLNGATGSNPTVTVSTWETILIDLPASVASTGTLTFVIDATTGSARDDIWIDNVEVLTLEIPTGDDVLTGGLGDDVFVYAPGDGNDTITDFNDGNTGTLSDGISTNNDFIDLSGFYDHISELHADQADDGILNQSNDGVDGVDYSNNLSFGTGSLTFTGAVADGTFFTVENTGVVCFTSGTAILTPQGERLIDDLVVGDLVSTLDNGPQPVRWIGRMHLGRAALLARPDVRPVLIPRGVLGAARTLLVSPQHGMLLGRDHLVRAKHLVDTPKTHVRIAHGRRSVTYIHLMFDAHQVIFAEGTASESFYPGPMALRVVSPASLAQLRTLFPGACAPQTDKALIERSYGDTARPFLQKRAIAEHFRDPHINRPNTSYHG